MSSKQSKKTRRNTRTPASTRKKSKTNSSESTRIKSKTKSINSSLNSDNNHSASRNTTQNPFKITHRITLFISKMDKDHRCIELLQISLEHWTVAMMALSAFVHYITCLRPPWGTLGWLGWLSIIGNTSKEAMDWWIIGCYMRKKWNHGMKVKFNKMCKDECLWIWTMIVITAEFSAVKSIEI